MSNDRDINEVIRQRDNYKAVLIAMEFRNIDTFGKMTESHCASLGVAACERMKQHRRDSDALHLLLEVKE